MHRFTRIAGYFRKNEIGGASYFGSLAFMPDVVIVTADALTFETELLPF